MMEAIVFKKCSSCKEVLGLDEFPCNGKHAWCRMCAAEKAREYRKTPEYRRTITEYNAKPEVQEARRNAARLRQREARQEWKTPRGKLMNMRNLARYRARRHEIDGNDAAAKHQWQRAEMLTREIKRIDRDAKREKGGVRKVSRVNRNTSTERRDS